MMCGLFHRMMGVVGVYQFADEQAVGHQGAGDGGFEGAGGAKDLAGDEFAAQGGGGKTAAAVSGVDEQACVVGAGAGDGQVFVVCEFGVHAAHLCKIA